MKPLIYIHKGYSWYVPLALLNGTSAYGENIYYLGGRYGCLVARLLGVKSYPISHYLGAADAFGKIYRHHSDLSHDFELFCIQRWFILAEFLEFRKLGSCIYLDTDVLLTRNLDAEVEQTQQFGLTFTGYSAHVCFVNRLDAIQKFCQYITDLYADPASEFRFREWHQKMVRESGSGGVSDMTLFYWFQKEHPEVLGDYPAIFGDSPIDVSLEEVRGFQSDEDGFKKLIWKGGIPSVMTNEGRSFELSTLHHQGRGKSLMSSNATRLGVGCFSRFTIIPFLNTLSRFQNNFLILFYKK